MLYHHAEVKKAKVEQMAEAFLKSHYPFKPTVEGKTESEPLSAHIEKLHNSRKPIEAHLDKERIRLMGKWDPETGAELYRPRIGRPPQQYVSHRQRDKKTPIGDYLHMIQPVRQEQTLPNADISQFIVSKQKSDQIYEKMKRERFKEIFEVLKDPETDSLTADSEKTQKLSADLTPILAPLLEELQRMEETLNFEEFCASMDNLMKVLSPTEKAVLLRKPETLDVESVKESTSKDSLKRSQSVGLIRDLSLYDREVLRLKVATNQALEERLREEKAQSECQQTAECSFRPAITPYDPSKHAPAKDALHIPNAAQKPGTP